MTTARSRQAPSSRISRAGSAAVAVAVTLAIGVSSGCVGSGKIARDATLEPFPEPIKTEYTGSAGCRAGESGFDYRYLVVGPADLSAGSDLLEHVRTRGFYRTGLYLDDLPWVGVGYQHSEHPIRVELGTLDRYLADQRPYTGPPLDAIPTAARNDASRYVLIAIRPTDFACSTPL